MSSVTGSLIFILLFGGFFGCTSKNVVTKIPFMEQYIKGNITRLGDAKSVDSSNVTDDIGPPFHPNPFCPTFTTIIQVLKEDSVTITYYDVNGKMVCEGYRGYLSPGEYKFEPTDFNVNSGVYFINCTVGNKSFVRKGLLIR